MSSRYYSSFYTSLNSQELHIKNERRIGWDSKHQSRKYDIKIESIHLLKVYPTQLMLKLMSNLSCKDSIIINRIANMIRIYSRIAALSIGIVRRAGQLGTLADAHLCHALIPSFDHLTCTQLELERLPTIARGIKLGAVGQSACSVVKQIIILYCHFFG